MFLFLYFQRNPDDYLARRKAQEEEERLEKSKYPRRYQKSEGGDKDVTKRRSYYVPRPDDEAQRVAREYRQKRRSLNFDKRSDSSDKSTSSVPAGVQKEDLKSTEYTDKPLEISTDSADSGFNPESASSPRAVSPEILGGPRSPRSAVSPPRPSTKRKVAPPPPCSKRPAPTPQSAPAYLTTSISSDNTSKPTASVETKPSVQESKPSPKQIATQQTVTPKPSVQPKPQQTQNKVEAGNVKPADKSTATKDQTVPASKEILQPNRPPRRKKKSVEESQATQEIILKDQNQSKDITIHGANIEITAKDSKLINEPVFTDDKDSLLNAVIKDLSEFKTDRPVVEESVIEYKVVGKEESVPVNKTVIAINGDSSELDDEIKPVKIEKPRGKIIDSELSSKIVFVEKDLSESDNKAVESDSDTELVTVANVNSRSQVQVEFDDPDAYLDQIKPMSFKKAPVEDLDLLFTKISTFEDRQKLKDTKDTISIASDISSAGSEAPPLPDSAPPPLPVSPPPAVVSDLIQPKSFFAVESTNPNMADTVPEITAPASPREVISPISDLKASMFSMRVTSPTRDVESVKTNGVLTVDVGEKRKGNNSDSDLSDCEGDGSEITGTFTPGKIMQQSFVLNNAALSSIILGAFLYIRIISCSIINSSTYLHEISAW